MKAVFLCGGVGSRMFPVTEDKFLIKFLGKPLLLHQIYMAREAGLKSFILIGNPQNIERIKLLLNDVHGIECSYYVQEKPLGMADALKSATAVLNGEILIINPNDVFSIKAYLSILDAYRNNSSESYLLGYKVKQYFSGGYMVVNEIGELTSIIEKPEKGKEPSDIVNIVVHLHKEAKQLLNYIDKVNISQDAVYETAIDLMIKDGLKFKVVGYEDTWMAIKYSWHIFPVYEYFVNQQKAWISPESIISDRAVIEGNVYISDGVRVMENAVIRG
ncbi:MAG: NDP-sugar synthase, partial [Chloroflexi bacterium]|nr:NDP-sugar synthase [Chloroflexota bacterium]